MEIRGKKINNLIVGGCSFSSYTEVDKNYGTYLSELLGIKNIDGYNAGCGSNDRIWRTILTGIREGTITSSDLLIIQYTTVERTEFWSRHVMDTTRLGHKTKGTKWREDYGDGQIIKFKFNMIPETPKEELEFFTLIEENFMDDSYEFEKFQNKHMSFVKVLDSFKINTIFLGTNYSRPQNMSRPQNTYDSEYCSYLDVGIFPHGKYCLSETDCFHMSCEGHKKMSEVIHEEIKKM